MRGIDRCLEVDPARRLADALGLAGIGNLERPVPLERLKEAGLTTGGKPQENSLWAAMLDTKRSCVKLR